MRVDVRDILGVHTAGLERTLHRAAGALALRVRRREVVHVGAGAVARDLRDQPGAARLGVLHVFEHEHHRAFAHHETVATEVEGPAGFLGLVVALARRLDLREGADRERCDGCFGATRQHRHRVPALDDLGGLTDAVRSRRAGADDGVVGAAGMRVDGDQAGRHVRDHHRDSEGADALRPALHQRRVALFDLLEAADARAHDDADVVGIHLSGIQSRLRKRLLGRGQSELAGTPLSGRPTAGLTTV